MTKPPKSTLKAIHKQLGVFGDEFALELDVQGVGARRIHVDKEADLHLQRITKMSTPEENAAALIRALNAGEFFEWEPLLAGDCKLSMYDREAADFKTCRLGPAS